MPTILYEDADVLVAVKPAGILSEPAANKKGADILALLEASAASRGERLFLYPVHRLDRETGGIMVFAKSAAAAARLSAAITGGETEKEYLAVIEGRPASPEGALCDLLFFDRARGKSYVVTRPRRGVKEARLFYTAEREFAAEDGSPRTLLRIRLETGRTHQIRVQFASRGTPLVGDRRYGAKTGGRLALFATRLSFPHPRDGRRMAFSALPDGEFGEADNREA